MPKKFILPLLLIFSAAYSQMDRSISFLTGTLMLNVDLFTGNFGVRDISENDPDFSSFLFGSVPSSFFQICVDGEVLTLDKMTPVYPLGLSLGSQIDGIYIADRSVQVEVAYFALDMLGNNDFNSIGLVLNVSNISIIDPKKINIKIMLDTDIGESRNDPSLYLPSGARISNSIRITNNVPDYLFVGRKNITEGRTLGKGFYIYPYVSMLKPESITIANWRRIAEQSPDVLNPSFSYRADSTKDAGVEINFGAFTLTPGQAQYAGMIISKEQSGVFPVLEDESIAKGVFSEDRFEIEEIFKFSPQQQKLAEETPIFSSFQKQRELYRMQRTHNTPELQSGFTLDDNLFIPGDAVWKYLYELNFLLKNKSENLDGVLQDGSHKKSFFQ